MDKSIKLFVLFLLSGMLFGGNLVLYPNVAYVNRDYNVPSGYFKLVLDDIYYPSYGDLSVFSSTPVYVNRESTVVDHQMKSLFELINESIGKEISFKSEGELVKGKLEWYSNGYLGVNTGDGITLYNLDNVDALSLTSTPTIPVKREVYTILGYANQPSKISVNYHTSQIGWEILYDLDLDDSTLKESAHIYNRGKESFDGFNVRFMISEPHLISSYRGTPILMKSYAAASPVEAMDANDYIPPTASTYRGSGSWMYVLDKPINLSANGDVSFQILTRSLENSIDERIEWDSSWGSCWRVVSFTNDGSETLPSGKVRIYRNNIFIGEDSLDMLPSGDEVSLRISTVPEIKVEPKQTSHTTTSLGDQTLHRVSMEYTVHNYDSLAHEVYVKVRLPQYLQDFSIDSTDPSIYKKGDGWIMWKINIDAGKEKVLKLSYSYKTNW